MTYLAIDYGAGSGRVIAGTLSEGRLVMEELHRFPNRMVRLGDHLHWDFPALFAELKEGLRIAARRGLQVAGIGVDTWGVDFGLIDRGGHLLGNPVCYRDGRTQGMAGHVFRQLDAAQHYGRNGIQVMEINTLFQLYSMKHTGHPQLGVADRLLFMPDLFNYFLTGVACNEYTIASTSQLLDARTRQWDTDTIARLGLPPHIFGDIVQPGTVLGTLRPDIAEETGLGPVDVIAVGSHDTASAVAAVPAEPDERPVAFLSSGTWSLLGVELEQPVLTEAARCAEFTNEGGVGGRITFLQNITGLWILQRLMAEWKARGEEQYYDTILKHAAGVSTEAVIPVDAPCFSNPSSMEQAIVQYCRDHAMTPPRNKAEMVKCVLQSLAQKYAQATERLNSLLPRPVGMLHVIGGGSQNTLLNQLTARALGVPVCAGPVEATAMGNILTQALAKGEVADLQEMRAIVRNSR